jgi:hypothetical protein
MIQHGNAENRRGPDLLSEPQVDQPNFTPPYFAPSH